MNALERVTANDSIAQSGTVFEDKDSAGAAGIFVGVAGPAAVVLLIGHVPRTGDRHGRFEGLYWAFASRNGQVLAGNGCGHRQSGKRVREMHGENW